MVDAYILKTLIQILAQGDIGSYVIDLEKEKKNQWPPTATYESCKNCHGFEIAH